MLFSRTFLHDILSKLTLNYAYGNNCKYAADTGPNQIDNKLVCPVYFFTVFIWYWNDSKPDAAEYGTHSVHAESGTVQCQCQNGNSGMFFSTGYAEKIPCLDSSFDALKESQKKMVQTIPNQTSKHNTGVKISRTTHYNGYCESETNGTAPCKNL